MMSSSEVSVEVRKFPDSAEKRNLKRNHRYMVSLFFWGEIWWCHHEIMHYAAWNIAKKKKRFSKDKIFFQDYKIVASNQRIYQDMWCTTFGKDFVHILSWHEPPKQARKKYLLYMSAVQNLREDLYIKSFFQDQIWKIQMLNGQKVMVPDNQLEFLTFLW